MLYIPHNQVHNNNMYHPILTGVLHPSTCMWPTLPGQAIHAQRNIVFVDPPLFAAAGTLVVYSLNNKLLGTHLFIDIPRPIYKDGTKDFNNGRLPRDTQQPTALSITYIPINLYSK